jgi:hypothetical protein
MRNRISLDDRVIVRDKSKPVRRALEEMYAKIAEAQRNEELSRNRHRPLRALTLYCGIDPGLTAKALSCRTLRALAAILRLNHATK